MYTVGYIRFVTMARPDHPNKEIEAAIEYAEELGWRIRYPMGHWGRMFCKHADRDGCQFGINGTPINPETHAKQIRRAIDRCPHKEEANDENV
jgi:hypothetical protein